eukprot:gnl/Dysnectes_brevis/3457_a4378_522.p1 GENE.gnl/Dysnectes_brevis/3457_a4378_522~~gnl/Dysnectes_brevis/3457_a4378_522.p1  ORF type:complete len:609 (+),score=46.95 gnl/Dysnectes_brevis/3457_a4378_522:790-2616(+)
MKCMKVLRISIGDWSPDMSVCDSKALSRLNEQLAIAHPPRTALPLLLHVDEVTGTEEELFRLLRELMCSNTAVCYVSGLRDVELKKILKVSNTFLVPYRLSPLIKPSNMLEFLRTSPYLRSDHTLYQPHVLPSSSELDSGMIPLVVSEAVRTMISSGGNPRVLVYMMRHYMDTKEWTSNLSVLDLKKKQPIVISPDLVRVSLAGLPLLEGDCIIFKAKVQEGSLKPVEWKATLVDLEFKHNVMCTSFWTPPPRHQRRGCCKLTDFCHISMPFTVLPITPDTIEELIESTKTSAISVKYHTAVSAYINTLLTCTSDDGSLGLLFEYITCLQLIERSNIWLEGIVRPTGTDIPVKGCAAIPLVRLFGPPRVLQPAAVATAADWNLVTSGDAFWGNIGVSCISLPPQQDYRVLTEPFASVPFMDPRDFPNGTITDLNDLQYGVYQNAEKAPAPDAFIIGERDGTGRRILIVLDDKLVDTGCLTLIDQYVKAAALIPRPDVLVSVRATASAQRIRDAVRDYMGDALVTAQGQPQRVQIRVEGRVTVMTVMERRRQLIAQLIAKKADNPGRGHPCYPPLEAMTQDSLLSMPHVILGGETMGPALSALISERYR